MTILRIVIDTGVFWRPEALQRLAEAEADVVVPAVVYLERLRQILRDGQSVLDFEALIRKGEFVVEAFDVEQARRIAPHVTKDSEWGPKARDALIAAHVRGEDLLWTTNPKDFLAQGISPDQVITVS